MSTSRARPRDRRTAAKPGRQAAATYVSPATVSRDALLENGSDQRFRRLIYDLLTLTARMETVRGHLGARIGLSGPQYSLLVAIAHLQGDAGVSVGAVAQLMHVSSAFVATETGKLARLGLLLKRPNPDDRRGVRLSLAPAGRLKIDRLSPEMRAINDLFFGGLDARSFAALCSAAAALVAGSHKALQFVAAVDGERPADLEAAG